MAGAAEVRYAQLLRLATRLFYELGEVLVVEALIHAPRHAPSHDGPSFPEWQLDEEIAKRLNLHAKQVRTLLARLVGDRLVVQHRKEIHKATPDFPGARVERSAPSSDSVQCYYAISYEIAADAVRFKLNAMERMLDEQRRDIEQEQNFLCNNCNSRLNALEINYGLLDDAGDLCCPNCMHTLQPEDNSALTSGIEELRQKLRSETKPLLDLLAETRGLEPPSYKKPRSQEGEGLDSSSGKGSHSGASGSGSSRNGEVGTLGASKGPAALRAGGAAQAVVPWMMSTADRLAAEAAKAKGEEGAEQGAADPSEPTSWLAGLRDAPKTSEAAPEPLPTLVGSKRKEPMSSSVEMEKPSGMQARDAAVLTSGSPSAGVVDDDGGEDEDMVMVQGVPKPLSEVTEEDQDKMTKEEFDAFCELTQ